MDSISPTVIAWFFPVFSAVIFILINWKVLSNGGRFATPFILYGFSLGTGILADIYLGFSNAHSAWIAGIWAPLAYTLLFSLILYLAPSSFLRPLRNSKGEYNDPNNVFLDDHIDADEFDDDDLESN